MSRHAILVLIGALTAVSVARAGTPDTAGSAPTVGAAAATATSAVANTGSSAAPSVVAPAVTPPAAAVATGSARSGAMRGTVTTKPGSAAKWAVVYLEDGAVAQAVNGSINNKLMTFSPYVSVVTAGAKVTFTNADPFPHNVFSPDHEKWDLGQLVQHGTITKSFAKPGAYTLLCNMHPTMKAYVLVVPSSYFVRTDAQGSFTLKDVPAGTYKVSAWAPGLPISTQTVTVDGDASLTFDLHR